MRKGLCIILAVAVLSAVGCRPKADDRTEEPRRIMQQALNEFLRGEYGQFMSRLDFGGDFDSLQEEAVSLAFIRQQQVVREARSGMQGALVVSAKMQSDSVATVFFREYFANGDSLDCSQKLVRKGGEWRLRMRN